MKDSLFSIKIDGKDIKNFILPFKDIQKIKVNQAVFKFSEKDKTIRTSTINDNNTVMSILKYKTLEDSEIENDFEFSIHDLNEFINCLSIFDDGVKLYFNEKMCEMVKGDSKIRYYGSESGIIKQGKEKLNAKVNWYTNFVFDPSENSSFIKALNVINGKHIIFTGKKSDKKITIQIRDKELSISNSFNNDFGVDEVYEDFRTVIDKEYFMSIINGSSSVYNIQIGNLLVLVRGSTPVHTVDHCIAPVV